MDQVPLLTATTGHQAGHRFVIDAEGLVVGRDPGCEVHVDDPGVSREHARIFLHNASIWVQDTGSRNGIYVNGKRVTRPKQVSPGDELKVGDHRFTIELGAAEDSNVIRSPRPLAATGPTRDALDAPTSPSLDAVELPPPPASGPPKALLIGGAVVLLLAVIGLAIAFL